LPRIFPGFHLSLPSSQQMSVKDYQPLPQFLFLNFLIAIARLRMRTARLMRREGYVLACPLVLESGLI
jgi:hypothetical protein